MPDRTTMPTSQSPTHTQKRRPLHLRLGLQRAAVLLALCAGPALAQVPHIAPTGQVWPAGEGFAFSDKARKTRQSVSGIACALNAAQARVCLVVFDEGMEARFARLADGRLMPQPGGVRFAMPGKELDAEGAATDGRYFYVTGSHAVKRSDCKPNASSQHVLRFQRDPVTGQALAATDGSAMPAGYQHTQRLLALFAADFQLQDGLGTGRCLGTGALDIEALAVRDGRLWDPLESTCRHASLSIL